MSHGILRNLILTALVLMVLIWATHFLRLLLIATVVVIIVVTIAKAVRWWDETPERAERRAVERELRRMRRYTRPMARIERRMRDLGIDD